MNFIVLQLKHLHQKPVEDSPYGCHILLIKVPGVELEDSLLIDQAAFVCLYKQVTQKPGGCHESLLDIFEMEFAENSGSGSNPFRASARRDTAFKDFAKVLSKALWPKAWQHIIVKGGRGKSNKPTRYICPFNDQRFKAIEGLLKILF